MAGEIFISYRRADEAWARLLHAQLQAQGVEAWYDAQIGAGQDWRSATAKALENARIFVLLFSAAAAQSEDIAKELAAAIYSKKLVVPVRIEDIQPTGAFLYELASRNWVNAFEHTEAKLAELAQSLAKLVKSGIADESIIPFDRNAGAKAPAKTWLRKPVMIAAAAAIAVTAAAAALLWPHPKPVAAPVQRVTARVAVLPFEILGDDAALRQFAGGLQAEIIDDLSQSRVPVVSRQDSADLKGQDASANAAKFHIAYAFGGTVERRGKDLLVRMHLDDARQSVTVWSYEFSGDAGDPELLQKEISALASQAGSSAVGFDRRANGDTEAMNLLIKANIYAMVNRPQDREDEWDNTKKLAAKFPRAADFQSNFAVISAFLAINSAPARTAELRAIARTSADRAIVLNPHTGIGYIARALIFPSIGHWTEREKVLLQGLAAAPQNAGVTNHESNFLREVGRLKDAVAYGRQTRTALPTSANRDATLILAFAATGNAFEGDALAETAAKSWPLHPAAWNARLQLATFNSRWDAALALLAPGGYVPVPVPVADAWRGALMAAKSGNPVSKRDAVRRIVAQFTPAALWPAPSPNEVMSPGDMIGLLAMLGDKDAAFAQAKVYLKRDTYADSSFLFWPNLTELRRDPRFMALANEVGLVDYWRGSGNWPDFCTDPGLPYNCQTEANRLRNGK
jgi:TolB-like protein